MTYRITEGYSTSLVAALLLVMTSLIICPTAAPQEKAALCPPIEANFIVNDTCLGAPTVFTDQSTGNIQTWLWSFGDGATSTDQNPTHTYGAVGTYSVTLTVSGPDGSDSVTKTVSIVDGPAADFIATPMGGLAPLHVTFIDQSIDAETWHWDFGDGAFDTVPNPVHTFDSAGWYDVWLVVSNRCGIDSVTRQIRVKPTPPVADFEAHDACLGDTVFFTDLSTGGISYWRWFFGDGDTSRVQNPSHLYGAVGTYTITLIVLGPSGTDSVSKTINIWDTPSAGFTAVPLSGTAPLQVAFTDQSINGTDRYWEFGDGTSDTMSSPVHTFYAPGTYDVLQMVSNLCGVDTATTTITVIPPPPVADFEALPRGRCITDTVQFTDLSTGIIDTWHWEFGDGDTSNVQHPTHVYPDTGLYTITLTVTGPGGSDSETKSEYIKIWDTPIAAFDVVPDSGEAPLTVQITDQSIGFRRGHFEFGDGTQSPQNNPKHTYSTAGVYTITRIVRNPCGVDSAQKTVIVTNPPPVADFVADPRGVCLNDTVVFTDLSTGVIDTWRWEFGDGDTSNVQHPTHIYPDTGLYTVTLTVTGPGGTDSETKSHYINVYGTPQAGFNVVPDSGQAPLEVQIMNQSHGVRTGWYDFGDGTADSTANPSHTYDTAGVFTITQYVENPCGEDSARKTVIVTPPAPPVADFRAPDTCVGEYILFADLSTGSITSWFWEFGDGDTSIHQHPTHAYDSAKSYYVTLTVTGPGGSDSESKWLKIWDVPTAGFTAVPDSGAADLTVTFTDQSVDAASYFWQFGDGDTSTVASPVHVYDTVGTFTAIQTVLNMCGTDVDSIEIKVTDRIPPPKADFEAVPTGICEKDTVWFTDLSTGDIDTWLWKFGDGDSAVVQHPGYHIYDDVGTYTVSLTVTGPGGSDTETKTALIVVEGTPTADFYADPQIGRAPLTVHFNDLSTGATKWRWDLGDGNFDSVASPVHTYDTAGMFIVKLTASNDCGEDSKIDSIFVDEQTAEELLIFKSVDLAAALPGDTLTYLLTLSNSGDEVVNNVVVSDTMPARVSFVPYSLSGYGLAIHNPTTEVITWDVGSFLVGQTEQLTFKVTVNLDVPDGSVLVNKAVITGPRYMGEAIATTNVRAPLVTIEKFASPTVAMPGDTITYTVRVVNNGAVGLTDAILVDDLPTDFTYIANTARVNDTLTWVTGVDPITIGVGDIGTPDSAIITYDCEISPDADPKPVYINEATLYDRNGAGTSYGPVRAAAVLESPPLVITKTAGSASAQVGSLIRYLVEVENRSNITAPELRVVDTMPDGFVFVPGTAVVDHRKVSDPLGKNPYEWWLGDLAAGDKVTVEYTVQVTTSAGPGINENVAWAHATEFQSVHDTARVNVVSAVLPGKIRGRVIFDCDRDNVPDLDEWPTGIDIYLDDGSQSRSNVEGMFYFNIVRAGEHAVMLDTRDLDAQGYYLPEGEQSKVFVHVHETGEAYILFRVCPAHPILEVNKQAAIVPKARATKIASIDETSITDSTGATVDYEIILESNGGSESTVVTLIDSLPTETRYIEGAAGGDLSRHERLLQCKLNVGQERVQRAVHYSLEDLAPGVRRFLTNRVRLVGDQSPTAQEQTPISSEPADVAVGPFKMVPPKGFEIDLVGAHFETSKADLRPEAIPVLMALADTILKYDEAQVHAEGHCDYRRIHNEEFPSNWELSDARAKAVVDWLADHGVNREFMTWEGFAATRPVDSGRSPEALQRNRRVEVFVKGRSGPVIDVETLGANRWESVTTLELEPVNWADAFDRPAAAEMLDLDDTWEVFITVTNTGRKTAEEALLADILPSGVEYVAGTCRIDGIAGVAEFDAGGKLSVKLGPIEPDQKVDVRYRIKIVPGTTPAGGGAASVKVIEPSTTVEYESNEVKFK